MNKPNPILVRVKTAMKTLLAALRQALSWNTHEKIRGSDRKTIQDWERNGKPAPPPHVVKQRNLRTIARQFGLKTLVETGTYYGDMVAALIHDFDKIYSIELGEDLHRQAVARFAGLGSVEVIKGDSGRVIKDLLPRINRPSLFWLDGHYSAGVTARGEKDTPVMEELSHIFDSAEIGHVIVVDDARCFGVETGYPSIEELSNYVKTRRPSSHIEVADDAIRIMPRAVR